MFPASSVDGAMDCVDVPIIDDGSPEPTESFSVSLSSISFGAGITTASTGTPSTAVVNIIDSTGNWNKVMNFSNVEGVHFLQ